MTTASLSGKVRCLREDLLAHRFEYRSVLQGIVQGTSSPRVLLFTPLALDSLDHLFDILGFLPLGIVSIVSIVAVIV